MRKSPRLVLVGQGPSSETSEPIPGGVLRLARALRDAGWEVVHLGAVPDAEVVAAVALDEDACAVGVVGPHDGSAVAAVAAAVAARGLTGVTVFDAGVDLDQLLESLGDPANDAPAPG